MQGGNPEPADALIDGADGGGGVFCLDQPREDSAFHAAVARQVLHGSGQIAAIECTARGLLVRIVHLGIGRAQKQFDRRLVIAAQEGRAEQMVVAAPAETLLAEIVGHSAFLEPANERGELHHIGRRDMADFDGEAVAAKMAQAQLVAVADGPFDVHVWQMQAHYRSSVTPRMERIWELMAFASFRPA